MVEIRNEFGFLFSTIDAANHLEEVFRLRFEIYVEELGFLSPEDYPFPKEIDKFDAASVHIAAINPKNKIVGAVRLVFHSPLGFPLEDHCNYPIFWGRRFPERQCVAEVSRLVIHKQYRRKILHPVFGFSSINTGLCDEINPIILGLYSIGHQISRERNITHWIAAMDSGLVRLVKRRGFMFQPIGETINYYGKVRPYIIEIEEIQKYMMAQDQKNAFTSA